jgi:hypothetical protein
MYAMSPSERSSQNARARPGPSTSCTVAASRYDTATTTRTLMIAQLISAGPAHRFTTP